MIWYWGEISWDYGEMPWDCREMCGDSWRLFSPCVLHLILWYFMIGWLPCLLYLHRNEQAHPSSHMRWGSEIPVLVGTAHPHTWYVEVRYLLGDMLSFHNLHCSCFSSLRDVLAVRPSSTDTYSAPDTPSVPECESSQMISRYKKARSNRQEYNRRLRRHQLLTTGKLKGEFAGSVPTWTSIAQ